MTCMMALLNAGFACQCNTICDFVLQFSRGIEIEVYKGEIILIDMCRLMNILQMGVVVSITFCALEDFYHITDGNGLMQRIF